MEKLWLSGIDAELYALTLLIVIEAQTSLRAVGQPRWTRVNDRLRLILGEAIPSLSSDYEASVELVTGGCILNVYLTDERGGYEIPFTLVGDVPLANYEAFPDQIAASAFTGWLRGLETAVDDNDDAHFKKLNTAAGSIALALGLRSGIDWVHCGIYPHLYGLHEIHIRPRKSGPDVVFRTRQEGGHCLAISDELAQELDRLVAGQGRMQLEFMRYPGELAQLSIGPGSAIFAYPTADAMECLRACAATPTGCRLEP